MTKQELVRKEKVHINCFHMTKFATLGFLTTIILFELIVMKSSTVFPFSISLAMLVPFIIALWITVNTVGRKLYQPQTSRTHLCLAYLGALMICYLTPLFFFLGAQLWDLLIYQNLKAVEWTASFIFYPLFGIIYGLPGALIFGTWLGKSVHTKVGERV